jgi:hypothetical protein
MNDSILQSQKETASILLSEFIPKFIFNSKDIDPYKTNTFSLKRPEKSKSIYSEKFMNTFFTTLYNTVNIFEINQGSLVCYHMSMDEEVHGRLMELLAQIEEDYEKITFNQLVELSANCPKDYEPFKLFLKYDINAPWIHVCHEEKLLRIQELDKEMDVDVLWNETLKKTLLLGKIVYDTQSS